MKLIKVEARPQQRTRQPPNSPVLARLQNGKDYKLDKMGGSRSH
jgi:hypothetical protein